MRITFGESTNLKPVPGLFNHATCYKKLQLRVVGGIVLLESLSTRLQAKSFRVSWLKLRAFPRARLFVYDALSLHTMVHSQDNKLDNSMAFSSLLLFDLLNLQKPCAWKKRSLKVQMKEPTLAMYSTNSDSF